MKMSTMFFSTMKEIPSDAEITSHILMIRAGLIRKMASGIYNYMPLGLRALQKIQAVIREELDRAGAQELLCSAILPAELWKESGRWEAYGQEMFRLQDRHERDFCLGPTHEEVFTDIVRFQIKSSRELPVTLYQIQTKYRDERRPRFGVMRSREFIMKDAYSFDKDEAGMDRSFLVMEQAYRRIFTRLGLDFRVVEADSGAIGGTGSAEFMVRSEVGEDEVVFCSKCEYGANLEKAYAAQPALLEPSQMASIPAPYPIDTPGIKTIEQLSAHLQKPAAQFIKTLLFLAEDQVIAVLLRGDHMMNEVKVKNALGVSELVPADPSQVYHATGAKPGYAGPAGLKAQRILVDYAAAALPGAIVGANETGKHLAEVVYGRDYQGQLGDFRNVVAGEPCPRCQAPVSLHRGIEVGHIFKLGTKYSEPMQCAYSDENGNSQPMQMGCYGIGVTRLLAAIIEQGNDSNGIIWPLSVAPYTVCIVPVMRKDESQMRAATELYERLQKAGHQVLLDDRDERPGVKFKDLDLMGIPFRITVGKKLPQGLVEYKRRQDSQSQDIPLVEVQDRLQADLSNLC